MTAANQTAISPKGTRRPAAPTVLHLHPLGSDADISLCGEKCTPVTPRAEKHGSIVYGVRRRIVVADMGLVRGSPRPRPYGGRGQADCSRKGGEEQS